MTEPIKRWRVVKKFSPYNAGEPVSATDSQAKIWNEAGWNQGSPGPVVVEIPPDIPAPSFGKAEMGPPVHKQIVEPEEAKDEERRGPGRPLRR